MFQIPPELQKLAETFTREMQEAAPRINAACKPVADSLVDGMRNLDAMLRQARNERGGE